MKDIIREYKAIARELGYNALVLNRIDSASSEAEISRIMASARKGEYNA